MAADWRQRLREIVTREPDARRAATELLGTLSQQEVDELLLPVLTGEARREMTRARSHAKMAAHRSRRRGRLPVARGGRSRWFGVRLAGVAHGFLLDASVADLAVAAAEYRERAQANTEWADGLDALAATLRQTGKAVVSQLDEAVITECLLREPVAA